MMKLYIAGNNVAVGQFLHLAADGEFDVEALTTIQDFASAMFRDRYAMGALGVTGALAAEAVRAIRLAEAKNPLFVLVADAGESLGRQIHTRIQCLIAGCDDVQPFPIDQTEYVARLRALMRRDRGMPSEAVQLPHCIYWPLRGVLHGDNGAIVALTRLEAEALNLLIERPHSIVTKEMLMQRLYNEHDEPQIKIVDVFICKIRKKLDAATSGAQIIETAWGRGYIAHPDGYEGQPFSHMRVSRVAAQ